MEITTIGGGTGTTAVLEALNDYSDLHLNAIISMADDGGSNQVVRDQFGLLPLSDLRKAIVALSSKNKNQLLRRLFTYRFSKGEGMSGHTLGNLIMIAMSDIAGSEKNAVNELCELFDTVGNVIPVSYDKVRLIAKYENGKELIGEHYIDTQKICSKISSIRLSNKAKANEDAIKAITSSQYIIVGPGDIYTSIIPNFLVEKISEAVKSSKAELILVSNLMTKKGETDWMKLSDLVCTLEKYIGRKFDIILANDEDIPKKVLAHYKTEDQSILLDDLPVKSKIVIRRNLISDKVFTSQKGDTLARSIVRHDPDKLGKELYSIFRKSDLGFFARIIRETSGMGI
ncbi:uridine diphosphate-N-acetylglucosamine-binding protein YvcK [Candidatus Dojkabacteria bacterium]|jgi:uncharacterized cofD-like protein|nr:uridine diphosphate-N-acetylglucosamine-binding protein YvcK [Candidatus Dojkabacteria bacterium]